MPQQHIIVERGSHTRVDVEAALYEGFKITQWWPVTIVECSLDHGELCKAVPFARAELERHGLRTRAAYGPGIPCHCGE